MRHKIAVRLTVTSLVLAGVVILLGAGCQQSGSGAGPTACPAVTAAPAAKVVNVTCPMMGSKIDPANVPDSLICEHKGQKVGLCCGGCRKAWDKLSDEEKDAKLQACLPER